VAVASGAAAAVIVTNSYMCVPHDIPTKTGTENLCSDGQHMLRDACESVCKDPDAHWNGHRCVVCDANQVWKADSKHCVKGATRRDQKLGRQSSVGAGTGAWQLIRHGFITSAVPAQSYADPLFR
jgi:hypothetical protein